MNGRNLFKGIGNAYQQVILESSSLNDIEGRMAAALREHGVEASVVRDFQQSVTEVQDRNEFKDQVCAWLDDHQRATTPEADSAVRAICDEIGASAPIPPVGDGVSDEGADPNWSPAAHEHWGEKSDVEYDMPKDSFPHAKGKVDHVKDWKKTGPENADNFKSADESEEPEKTNSEKKVKKESVSINNCKAQDMSKKTSFDKLFESVMEGEDELDALGIDPGAEDPAMGGEDDLDAGEESDLVTKVQDAIETLNMVVDILNGDEGGEEDMGEEDPFADDDEGMEDDGPSPFPEAVDAEYKADPLTGPDLTGGKQPSTNKVKGKATTNVKKGPGNPKVKGGHTLDDGNKGHAITNPDPSDGKQPSSNKVNAQNKFFGD